MAPRKKKTPIPGTTEFNPDDIPLTDEDADETNVKIILVDAAGTIGLVIRRSNIEVWQRTIHKEDALIAGTVKVKAGDYSNWQTSRISYHSDIFLALKQCWKIAIKNRLSEPDVKTIKDVLEVLNKNEELLDYDLFTVLINRFKK